MLKLNYTDYGLFIEQVAASLEVITNQRVMLAVHFGETLHLGPSRASLLLPTALSGISQLRSMLDTNVTDAVTLTTVDDEFIEVSLKGIWMAESANAESGTFMTVLPANSEQLIFHLWQVSQRQTAYFR